MIQLNAVNRYIIICPGTVLSGIVLSRPFWRTFLWKNSFSKLMQKNYVISYWYMYAHRSRNQHTSPSVFIQLNLLKKESCFSCDVMEV